MLTVFVILNCEAVKNLRPFLLRAIRELPLRPLIRHLLRKCHLPPRGKAFRVQIGAYVSVGEGVLTLPLFRAIDDRPYRKKGFPRSLLRGEKEERQLRLTNSHQMRICRKLLPF